MPTSTKSRPGPLLPGITAGFAAALALWCLWFATHFPGLHLPPIARAAALLGGPIVIFFVTGRALGRTQALNTGLLGGTVTGVLSLLLLGAIIGGGGEEADAAISDRSVNLALVSLGIVAVSVVTAVSAALVGSVSGGAVDEEPPRAGWASRWLFRFSLVTVAATATLLVLGAIVTSTESGMAVPDWPTTFSSNMFLFPMDHEVQLRVFLEHAHRLFGALTGFTTISLMILLLVFDQRRSVKIFGIVLFVAVSVQGVLGGFRVTENNAVLGIFHGILGQLFLGATVAMAVVLSPTFLAGRSALRPTPFDRRLRRFATGFLHTLIVQLILGATFRHLSAAGGEIAKGAMHALYTHAAFALVVAIFASAAGFVAIARGGGSAQQDSGMADALSPTMRRLGWTAVVSVLLQVMLGVAALIAVMLGGDRSGIPTHEQLATATPVPIYEAIITTAHHANGVLLMGVSAALFMWGKFVSPRRR